MSGQLKKAELVAALAEAASVDKKDANAVLDALTTVITGELKKGNAVPLAGLGKFAVRDRASRTVRNPSTGETKIAPADKAVKVVIAKALKEAVN